MVDQTYIENESKEITASGDIKGSMKINLNMIRGITTRGITMTEFEREYYLYPESIQSGRSRFNIEKDVVQSHEQPKYENIGHLVHFIIYPDKFPYSDNLNELFCWDGNGRNKRFWINCNENKIQGRITRLVCEFQNSKHRYIISFQIGERPIDYDYYKRVWGFDVRQEVAPAENVDYPPATSKYESFSPLEGFDGIKIGARVRFTDVFNPESRNLIVFQGSQPKICPFCSERTICPDVKPPQIPEHECAKFQGSEVREEPVTCTHTAIYQAPLVDTKDPEALLDLASANFHKPLNLSPEEHFVALKSYVEGINAMGIEHMFPASYWSEEHNATTIPFGFNTAMQRQVLRCLSILAPKKTRNILRNLLVMFITEQPDWFLSRIHHLDDTYSFGSLFMENDIKDLIVDTYLTEEQKYVYKDGEEEFPTHPTDIFPKTPFFVIKSQTFGWQFIERVNQKLDSCGVFSISVKTWLKNLSEQDIINKTVARIRREAMNPIEVEWGDPPPLREDDTLGGQAMRMVEILERGDDLE